MWIHVSNLYNLLSPFLVNIIQHINNMTPRIESKNSNNVEQEGPITRRHNGYQVNYTKGIELCRNRTELTS